MSHRSSTLSAMLAVTVCATVRSVSGSTVTFELLAGTDTPIPGGGGNFGFAFDPAIDGGSAVFWGRDVGGNDGIYTTHGGLQRVADRTTPIPSGAGAFTSFGGDPMINDGRVMLVGWGNGGQMGIYAWTAAPDGDGGALEMAVDLGVAIPGGTGTFGFAGWPSLNDGVLFFLGQGGSGQLGEYAYDFNGNYSVLVNQLTPIPGGTGKFGRYAAPWNDAGDLAFRGDGTSNQRGIYVRNAGGVHLIADRSTMSPQGPLFIDFGSVPSLDEGVVAFSGRYAGGQAVYRCDDGTFTILVDTDTAIPGGGGTFSSFHDYISHSDGRVAFVGFGPSSHSGLYVADGSTLTKIIDRTDQLEGKQILQIASIDRDAFDGDQVGFVARFLDGSAGAYLATIAAPCVADLDASGAVDFGDILAVLSAWGNAGGPEDLDDSGAVDFGDVLVILAAWGPC